VLDLSKIAKCDQHTDGDPSPLNYNNTQPLLPKSQYISEQDLHSYTMRPNDFRSSKATLLASKRVDPKPDEASSLNNTSRSYKNVIPPKFNIGFNSKEDRIREAQAAHALRMETEDLQMMNDLLEQVQLSQA
jgi:hypothetical protein